MYFTEAVEGHYRIYAGALEAANGTGGYVAAVVVRRYGQGDMPQEAFRDTAMSCGHRWEDPNEALMYAVARAREVILTEAHLLVC